MKQAMPFEPSPYNSLFVEVTADEIEVLRTTLGHDSEDRFRALLDILDQAAETVTYGVRPSVTLIVRIIPAND